jgi:hypothetical protein
MGLAARDYKGMSTGSLLPGGKNGYYTLILLQKFLTFHSVQTSTMCTV